MNQTEVKSAAMTGPIMMPTAPNRVSPPRVEISTIRSDILASLPTRTGRRILSEVETTMAPQAASPPAAIGCPVAASQIAAGTQISGGPIIGMIESRAAMAAQKIAPGTPATNRPTPVSPPWTKAIRKEPFTVARMVDRARSASNSRASTVIGSSVTAERAASRPVIRKKNSA